MTLDGSAKHFSVTQCITELWQILILTFQCTSTYARIASTSHFNSGKQARAPALVNERGASRYVNLTHQQFCANLQLQFSEPFSYVHRLLNTGIFTQLEIEHGRVLNSVYPSLSSVQGDHSGSSQPPVDIKTKFAF